MLEEDMALSNIALDLIGQARELYTYAAKAEGKDNDEDKLAYLRDVRQYRNLLLVEQPNGDFAQTMVRQFFYSAFADLYWRAMMASRDATLAAIAAKSEKESAYHLRHASEWIIRLGDGTGESHARAQAAIDHLWAFTGEMFAVDDGERALIHAGIADRSRDLARSLADDALGCRQRSDARAAAERLDAAGRPRRAGTASISAIFCPSCSRCSALSRGRHGDGAGAPIVTCASGPGTPRRAWSIPKFRF